VADLPLIESLFLQIKRKGLRLSELSHRHDGLWQARVRPANQPDGSLVGVHYQPGFGPDPQGALTAVLSKVDEQSAPGDEADDEDLIG
jgi:hypothetical protein